MAQVTVEALMKIRDEMSGQIKTLDKSVKKLEKSFLKNKQTLGDLKLKYLAVAAAVAVVSRAFKGALDAQAKQVDAINKLNLALANQGNLLPGTSKRLQEYASELQRVTTYGDEAILQNQALLASFGMNEEQLVSSTKVALDFAAATGRDVTMAVNLLGKAFVGETGELSRYGIVIDKNIPKSEKFAEVMRQLEQRFGGAAQTAAKNFTGQMQQMSNAFGDVTEAAGKFLGEFIKVGGGVQGTIGVFEWLQKFFGQYLVIALGEARALFSEFLAVVLEVAAKIAAALDWLPQSMQVAMFGRSIKGLKDDLRQLAAGARIAAKEFREESNEVALAAGKTQEFTNSLGQNANALTGQTDKIRKATKAVAHWTEETDTAIDNTLDLKVAMDKASKAFERFGPKAWELLKPMQLMNPAVKQLVDVVPGVRARVEEFGNTTDESRRIAEETSRALMDLAHSFQLLGITAADSIGKILIGVAALARAIPAIKDFNKSILGDPNLTRGQKFSQSMSAGAQGVAGVLQATGSGSQGSRAAGGAMQGAAAGGQIGGPIGAAVGAGVGALIGFLRGEGPRKAMKAVGELWGIDISQGLAEQISKTADDLDLSKMQASFLHLGDILREQGGITEDTFRAASTSFMLLLRNIDNGTIDMQRGMQAVNDAFAEMVDGLEKMGTKGSIEIGKMIKQMRELGLVTDEVRDYMKSLAESAIGNLGRYFEYLSKQTELTAEEAEAALTVMSGAFHAAVAATGNLIDAMNMLGPSFGELLAKMREVLGEENALLNTITQYYNYISANSEQLGALSALSQGFEDLLKLGIIGRDNIEDYAESFRQQMEAIRDSAADPNVALAAMGPIIGQLLEAFQHMGVEVPEWLKAMADAAVEAGASLKPPEGLPDILKDIRDIMLSIAEALGAASKNAREWGQNMGNVPTPPGWQPQPGEGGGDFGDSAQAGMARRLARDTRILAHAGEYVGIGASKEQVARQAGGGWGPISVGDVNVSVSGTGDPRKIADEVATMFENNLSGIMKRVMRRAKEGGHLNQ